MKGGHGLHCMYFPLSNLLQFRSGMQSVKINLLIYKERVLFMELNCNREQKRCLVKAATVLLRGHILWI